MKAFLQSVSDYLINHYRDHLDRVCVVFPNKRAALYLNKYLAQHLKKPVWAPNYTTISELMTSFSGLVPGDPLILQYELYKAYAQVHPHPEPFEKFYNWGLTILSDFDDIDKYRIEADQLFQNLSDLQEIDERFDYLTDEQKEVIRTFWGNARFDQPGSLKNNFLDFWLELGTIYPLFRAQIKARNIAYEGLIYQETVRKIRSDEEIPLPFSHYCLVGFNALNECEKVLFDFFRKSGKAAFFWDYDDYYVGNEWHEAGLFLRDNIKRYPPPPFNLTTNDLTASVKTIHIIAANNDVAQAKILPQVISGSPAGIKENTAVVLSDEGLLIPVLSSLPDSVDKVNITMGYPFSNSPAYTLLELIIRLFRSERKSAEAGRLFYYKDVSAFLNHPYLQAAFLVPCNHLLDTMVQEKMIYLKLEEFENIPGFFSILQAKDENRLGEIAKFLEELVSGLNTNPDTDPLDVQYLMALYHQTNILSDLIKQEAIQISGNAALRFLRQIAQKIKVSFIGEPLTDFQILGVLETRVLDFDHVIMLSVNEGILPARDPGNSFIPYHLRKALGMPTIEFHDAIYAYYFYRFIQRAGKLTLIYNAQSGGMLSGEMSRYLYQLQYDEHFNVMEDALTFQISIPGEKPISIAKTEEVYNKLLDFAHHKVFTPTSLNTWLTCSLKFYFQYLEGIKEKEEITDDVDASEFGRLVHKALFLLYKPFIGGMIQEKDIKSLLQSELPESAILESFEVYFPSRGSYSWKLSGKNLIIKEIILKYVRKILETDLTYSPFKIVSLENKYEREWTIPGLPFPVKMGGYIDRIDLKDGIYRIIDYKTGDVNPQFADLQFLFEREQRKQKDAAFQCLLYAFVISDQYPDGAIQAALFSIKKMFEKNFNPGIRFTKGETMKNIREVQPELENQLKESFSHMFDRTQPFTKTDDLKACENCPYKGICHR